MATSTSTPATLVSIGTLILLLVPALPASAANEEGNLLSVTYPLIDLSHVEIGAVVATGTVMITDCPIACNLEDLSQQYPVCEYAPFALTWPLSTAYGLREATLENRITNGMCELVLMEMTEDTVPLPVSMTAACPLQAKQVIARTEMYGHGGRSDDLTTVQTKMDFRWDCTTATQFRNHVAVYWSQGTGWRNDNYGIDNYYTKYSGSSVFAGGFGDFHWDPWWTGPAYYHTLYAQPWGDANGNTNCYHAYTGSIVKGITPGCWTLWINP